MSVEFDRAHEHTHTKDTIEPQLSTSISVCLSHTHRRTIARNVLRSEHIQHKNQGLSAWKFIHIERLKHASRIPILILQSPLSQPHRRR